MKTGQLVKYRDAAGRESTATVAAITGAGKSTCKTLDVSVDANAKPIANVPHYKDATPTGACWCLESEEFPAREEPKSRVVEAKEKEKEK